MSERMREYRWVGFGAGGLCTKANTRTLASMQTEIEKRIENHVIRGNHIVKCDATDDRYEIEVKVNLRRQR